MSGSDNGGSVNGEVGPERLYALAQALQVDFAAFKRLIEGTDVPA